MKIGVFLGNISPVMGGGFTFQESLLKEISNRNGKDHTFIFFYYGQKLIFNDYRGKSQFVFLGRYKSITKQWFHYKQLIIRFLNKIIRKILGSSFQFKDYHSKLEKAASQKKIKMLWFISPFYDEVGNIPYIFTVWDLQHRLQPYFPEVSANGEWEHRERIYSNAIPRASFVLTGTQAGKNELMSFYRIPSNRIKILPHPTPSFVFDYKETPVEVNRKFNIPENFIFYPAQFWPHKNHLRILQAVNYLKKEFGISLPIVFLGSDMGNQKYIIRKARELNVIDQLYMPGFVSRDDLVGFYRRALALIYPTYFGPENLPPLEALALGCPVIASKVSGAEEQLGDAAMLVDPGDEKEIALVIKQLIDQPNLRNELILKGKKMAKQYTVKNYTDDIISIITEFQKIRDCWE